MRYSLVLLIGFVFCSLSSLASNITLGRPVLVGKNSSERFVYVQFDLSWENSWRMSVTNSPFNYDAAWVFVKFRKNGQHWEHAYLHVEESRHMIGNTNGVAFETEVGTSEVGGQNRGVGVFLYRADVGNGAINWKNVRLRWDYHLNGVNDEDQIELKVFGIEMVAIPESAFFVGSGGSETGRFKEGGTTNTPFQIQSEEPLEFGDETGKLWGTVTLETAQSRIGPSEPSLPGNYPKGYQKFYCMKYEVAQGQYVDFLNTLTRHQQNLRTFTELGAGVSNVAEVFVMSRSASPQFRNGIRCDANIDPFKPVAFYCGLDEDPNEEGDGASIACNYLTWMDGAAYLDWAGLRPMTELEYEKVCRGTLSAMPNDYAWNTAAAFSSNLTIVNRGRRDEKVADGRSLTFENGYMAFSSTTDHDGFRGPVRVGAFAEDHNALAMSGASLYGAMEMSGNLEERVVNVSTVAGRSFTGLHGDGMLNDAGHATVDYWPGVNGNSNEGLANSANTSGVTHAAGTGWRGGSWANMASNCRISDRSNAAFSSTARTAAIGIRGVRTAKPEDPGS
jgi:formylglycine-generating enzyme required for sulfatase activity